MLQAVAHHPAMLIYLDNAASIGPDSKAGQRTAKGLNENLAREIMELHTLGVREGYGQGDVTSFARILTGWSVASPKEPDTGAFHFYPNRHEPGEARLLGRTYAQEGEAQGVSALQDLALHPATARHIAFQIARHFIADQPPEEAVARLAEDFRRTGGDLPSLYRVLICLPEAWNPDRPKFRSSFDLVVAAARLAGAGQEQMPWCLQSLRFLGNLPLTPGSPAGFPDTLRENAGPEALMRRIEWAQGAAGKLPVDTPYLQLAELAIGPVAGQGTMETLRSARNQREGMALLFGSPEFQRR
jgi:uncharacterized protein (DUF1800 family)